MPDQARQGDAIKQTSPHCHAPIHPAAPVPTPVAHPGKMLKIISATAPTVMVNGKQAAVVGSISEPCMMPSCVPAGPGIVALGSFTVFMCGLPAARKNDMTAHASCVAPIPGPVGNVKEGSSDVITGG